MCTIATATFNRASDLKILYNSLINQSDKNIEWIIIDDGSTDNTKDQIKKIQESCNDFEIKYYYQKNGGKHRAINKAIEVARGEYFFIVDSDDCLPMESIAIIKKWFLTIGELSSFVGVAGLKADLKDWNLIGKTFNGEYLDCSSLEREKNNIIGDKAEVFYTNILKKYRFPVFDNENFLSEAVLWFHIASDGYRIRWFNEVIYLCEYRENGLTKNIYKNYSNSPKGFALYINTLIDTNQISKLKKRYYYALYLKLTKTNINTVIKIFNCSLLDIYIGIFIYLVKCICNFLLKRKVKSHL